MWENNSMDFFGVKRRHPYPSTHPGFGVKAIIDYCKCDEHF
jgi:hypothetical protein